MLEEHLHLKDLIPMRSPCSECEDETVCDEVDCLVREIHVDSVLQTLCDADIVLS